jgi:ribosomal protein S18 acetylase RimI-like enzyme
MIFLEPMSEAEYSAYVAESIPEYARDKVAAGQWAEEASLELSRRGYEELLPQGLATADNHFFTVRDAATSQVVGMLWFAVQERAGEKVAYVYDISIRPRQQRQGHGKAVFAALENEARARGLAAIGLHVFGHNTGAKALYDRLGFEATNIVMFKRVAQADA